MTIKRFIIYSYQLLIRPKFLLKSNKIPVTTRIMGNVYMNHCTFGKYGYVASNTILNYCEVGAYCSIAPAVQIGGMEHPYWELATNTLLTSECIKGKITVIGHDVWIGAGSIIKQGITIGDGAVIGANSFVNKDVPPYAIVVGSPAKLIKFRFNENLQKLVKESGFWKYPPKEARLILDNCKKEHL
jgi:acetyltransferase-like isoleucine patch superfamily enzyme